MTKEQKRIKIAEALGWKRHKMGYNPKDGGAVFETFWTRPGIKIEDLTTDDIAGAEGFIGVPNYFGDLNAAHEMEKSLKEEQYSPYHYILVYNICVKPDSPRPLSARADQRSEAFGLTLGLWK